MDRKIGTDLWISCVCAAIMGIAWIYMEKGMERTWVLTVSIGLMVLFILLAYSIASSCINSRLDGRDKD